MRVPRLSGREPVSPRTIQARFLLKNQEHVRKENAALFAEPVEGMHEEVARVVRDFHAGKNFEDIKGGTLIRDSKAKKPHEVSSHQLYAIGVTFMMNRDLPKDEITPQHFRNLSRYSGLFLRNGERETLVKFHRSFRPQNMEVGREMARSSRVPTKLLADHDFTSKRTVDFNLNNISMKLKAAGFPESYLSGIRRYREYEEIRNKLLKTGRITEEANPEKYRVIQEYWGNGLSGHEAAARVVSSKTGNPISKRTLDFHVLEIRAMLGSVKRRN